MNITGLFPYQEPGSANGTHPDNTELIKVAKQVLADNQAKQNGTYNATTLAKDRNALYFNVNTTFGVTGSSMPVVPNIQEDENKTK